MAGIKRLGPKKPSTPKPPLNPGTMKGGMKGGMKTKLATLKGY